MSTTTVSSDIATWSWGIFQPNFTKFWPKNANIIKSFAEKVQYLYIFGKYMAVETSIDDVTTAAVSTFELIIQINNIE